MMTTTQLTEQLQKLMTLRRTLSREPGDLDHLSVQRTADDLDQIQQLAEHDLAARLLESRARHLREVHIAMDRLREGTYGICSDCEEEISWRRLQAVPWASRCANCQQEHESAREAPHLVAESG
jgi:DnaK suppressor protein